MLKLLDFGKLVDFTSFSKITKDGKEIQLRKELSEIEKYSIARVSVESAFDYSDGTYDILYADALFHVLLVKHFTNIEIDQSYLGGDELFTSLAVIKAIGLIDIINETRGKAYGELVAMKGRHEETLMKSQQSLRLLGSLFSSLGDSDVDDELLGKLETPEFKGKIENLSQILNKVEK